MDYVQSLKGVVKRGERHRHTDPWNLSAVADFPFVLPNDTCMKQLAELALPQVSDGAKLRLMKGKASSAAGIYWPIIPKWGDRQVCLILLC